jgi:pimeloyl-ACP methyl ester carboxylesterase
VRTDPVRTWTAALTRAVRDADAIYHPPATEPGATPADRDLTYRYLRVTTSRDGILLKGWVVPGAGPHTVVVCHGMGRTKSSVLDHIRLLHEAGHHVVAYDLRNHGESGQDGRHGRMADRFTSDLADVLRAVRADHELRGGRVGVLAFSFSTWPAVYVLRDRRTAVSAVICDSGPLYDIRRGFVRFSALRWAMLDPTGRRASAFRVYRYTFQLAARTMLAVRGWPPRLPGSKARLLFIAGAKDRMVPADEVMRVARRYPGAWRWVAANARHMNAVTADKVEYRRCVLEFLTDAFDSETANAS